MYRITTHERGRSDERAQLIAAWISLGDAGVRFELVARALLGFSLFRHQERLANIWSLSLAVLAGHGLAL